MVFDDDKEEVIDEEGLPDAEEADEDELEDEDDDEDEADMFGGEETDHGVRDRDWM